MSTEHEQQIAAPRAECEHRKVVVRWADGRRELLCELVARRYLAVYGAIEIAEPGRTP